MGRPIPAALDDAVDCSSVEPALRELVRERFDPGTELQRIQAEVVKRRVVRYTLALSGPVVVPNASWRLIGKVYETPADTARAFHRHCWLRDQGLARQPSSAVCIPDVYSHCAQAQTLFMEEVGGVSLKKLLRSEEARVAHMHLFAEGLARLHHVPGSIGEPFTLDDHLERRCAGLAGELAQRFPELAPGIETIVETARREADGTTAVAHGDYHPGQVHLDGPLLWILDLDPLHQGVPAYDVAMVLVTLGLMGRDDTTERTLRALCTAFLERYYSSHDTALARCLPIQTALILLKRACKRFRWRDEHDWPEAVRRQIRAGVAFASLQEGLPRPRSVADVLALYARFPGVA